VCEVAERLMADHEVARAAVRQSGSVLSVEITHRGSEGRGVLRQGGGVVRLDDRQPLCGGRADPRHVGRIEPHVRVVAEQRQSLGSVQRAVGGLLGDCFVDGGLKPLHVQDEVRLGDVRHLGGGELEVVRLHAGGGEGGDGRARTTDGVRCELEGIERGHDRGSAVRCR
jgi:hypothetical protein